MIIAPTKLYSVNLGDSRAVLGSWSNDKWKAEPITNDHKPTVFEEKDRIIQSNGRVFPFRDVDGEAAGPHRVWLKDVEVPGLAMSRSFGDEVASSVGVISEPEFMVRPFKEEDKFLIVATDGLWEFISNKEVVQIIGSHYSKGTIKGAVEELLLLSRKKWIEEEESVDDITIILVFF